VNVELRKMFDTRSGFWLMASIGIAAFLATVGVIGFAPDHRFTYATFVQAIRIPTSLLLPVIAILSVTSEWTQRSGLTTFTLVPHRRRIIGAKAIAAVVVGVGAMVVTFSVAALGNLAGAAATSHPAVWDAAPAESAYFVLGSVLAVLTGFMLGLVTRASSGALAGFLVYMVLLPIIFGLAATRDGWFRTAQPWLDVQDAQRALFGMSGALTGDQWAHVAVTGLVWLVLPLAVGLRQVMRSEIK
jgi:hypothetical protein